MLFGDVDWKCNACLGTHHCVYIRILYSDGAIPSSVSFQNVSDPSVIEWARNLLHLPIRIPLRSGLIPLSDLLDRLVSLRDLRRLNILLNEHTGRQNFIIFLNSFGLFKSVIFLFVVTVGLINVIIVSFWWIHARKISTARLFTFLWSGILLISHHLRLTFRRCDNSSAPLYIWNFLNFNFFPFFLYPGLSRYMLALASLIIIVILYLVLLLICIIVEMINAKHVRCYLTRLISLVDFILFFVHDVNLICVDVGSITWLALVKFNVGFPFLHFLLWFWRKKVST